MKIIKSTYTGLCAGVMRAYKAVTELKSYTNLLYLTSPLAHNSFLEKELSIPLYTPEVADNNINVIISCHGCYKSLLQDLKSKGVNIIDCTCPVVLSNIEKALSVESDVIYIGSTEHSEVKFFSSFIKDKKVIYISSLDEAKSKRDEISSLNNPSLLVQTTFSSSDYSLIYSYLISINNTLVKLSSICPDCLKRRKEALNLAFKSKCHITVGDKRSSNANVLNSISKSVNPNSFFIEDDLELEKYIGKIKKFENVSIISSASSPHSVFDLIVSRLERI